MRRVVQHDRQEAADGAQLVGPEYSGLVLRIDGQKSVRTQLRRPQPEVVHLGEHPIDRQLQAPVRHLADTPRDGGATDPVSG